MLFSTMKKFLALGSVTNEDASLGMKNGETIVNDVEHYARDKFD